METHRRSYFTGRGIALRRGRLRVSGQRALRDGDAGDFDELDLLSGAMHYWRLDRKDWPDCLAAMKRLGLAVVDTYVPWGVHEIRPGKYDWQGEYDLAAFIDQVARVGMYVIVRPGPHINAELTYFGFPKRVLKSSDCLAVSGRNTPVWMPAPPRMFPVPSYASRVFQDQVAAWFAAVGELLSERLAPGGPVIAVQVDNEAQMFFRLGAYDHDYHPDALAWWDEYSGGKAPPRAWNGDDAETCVRWVRFKEEYLARSLTWLDRALDDAGFAGLARFHNLPPARPTLVNLPRTARAVRGVAGMDFYHRAADYRKVRRRGLYLAGSAERLPYAPELGVGGPPWLPPMSEDDQRNVILGLLATGIRAFNLYMTVERDRWYGAPISEIGELRGSASWFRRLLSTLAEVEWTALRREVPVALISSRAEARFATASSVADPASPVVLELLGLGPAGAAELAMDEDAAAYRRCTKAIEEALDLAQIPYELVDEDCSLEHIAAYRVVIAPTLERVDRGLWKKLRELGQRGAVVVIGPNRPSCDEYGRPLAGDAALPLGVGLIQAASLGGADGDGALADFAEDLADLVGDLPDEWLADQDGVDSSVFRDAGGAARVLFAANSTDSEIAAEILVPGEPVLVDALTEEQFLTDGDVVEVPLAPHQVRMLLID